MATRALALPLLATVLLAGCATGPHVVALPGTGKTLEQFTVDDAACRDWVSKQAGSGTQWRYDSAYVQCMYARGHKVPVPGGWGAGSPTSAPASAVPADVPAPPPGPPPPPPPGPSR